METIEEVRAQILARLSPLSGQCIPLEEAHGRWLRDDVFAHDSIPPFDNSSMDGFGIRSAETLGANQQQMAKFKVIGQVEAGAEKLPELAPGQAVRIYTGAPIPDDVDAVVPWENTASFDQDQVLIETVIAKGHSIRRTGEDLHSGDLALPAGTQLTPAAIGMLASVGCATVNVGPRLRIAVHSTGNELVSVDSALRPGKIRNSNLYSIAARVERFGATVLRRPVLLDTPEAVRAGLRQSLSLRPDVIITTGGVSAGDLDYVREVAREFGDDVAVRKVLMKPGKPLVDGRIGGVPFFGLPGNPAACLVSFETFVRPALAKLEGRSDGMPTKCVSFVASTQQLKPIDRTQYLRGICHFDLEQQRYQVEVQGSQGSHQMRSFALANCFLEIPPQSKELCPNMALITYLLD